MQINPTVANFLAVISFKIRINGPLILPNVARLQIADF